MGPRPRRFSPSPSVFFLDFFFRDWSLQTGPHPAIEWNSFLPLVTAVSITPKGAESPGSRRIGVIGALVLILPSETGQTFLSLASPVEH